MRGKYKVFAKLKSNKNQQRTNISIHFYANLSIFFVIEHKRIKNNHSIRNAVIISYLVDTMGDDHFYDKLLFLQKQNCRAKYWKVQMWKERVFLKTGNERKWKFGFWWSCVRVIYVGRRKIKFRCFFHVVLFTSTRRMLGRAESAFGPAPVEKVSRHQTPETLVACT